MKKIVLFLGCIMSLNLIAQVPKVKNDPTHDDNPIHFGFSIGLNTMDFNIKQSQEAVTSKVLTDVVTLQPGFQVHAISNIRLGKYFDFRMLPGISFGGEREISYLNMQGGTTMSGIDSLVRIESNFLEMPFLIKYKAKRINNFRPFLIGGANLRFDLAATKKTWGVSKKGNSLLLLNVFDYDYEIGFGIDFYLENFKFAVEFKYSVGLTDVLKRSVKSKDGTELPPAEYAIYTNVIDRINSRMFMVSFHFE